MRVLRPLALSLLTGILVESACFKAPDDRDFGNSSSTGGGGGTSDASAGGTGGASGSSTTGGSAGKGGASAGGGGASQSGGTAGDAQAPDGGRRCATNADCDDHDTCSGVEKCVAGVCNAGTPLANKTACSVVSGASDAGAAAPGLCFDGTCSKKCADTSDCDDKDPCDGQETCDGSRGVCVQGVPPKCDDSNDCTKDSCDPKTGACMNDLVDSDGDGHAPSSLGTCGDDCNDADKTIYAGAPELCDGKDNDCNKVVDDNTPFWFVDCDGDGFSDSKNNAVQQCNAPSGGPSICGGAGKWTAVAPVSPATVDCNDAAPLAFPGNPEVCDGIDNDCSGIVDDVLPKKWADCDGDGFARPNAPTQYACVYNNGPPAACSSGIWTTTEPVPGSTDCDDTNSALNPYAGEDCANPDNVDNNCDGVVDGYRWFQDCDSDGYAAAGATNTSVNSCAAPMGGTTCSGGGGQWTTTYPIGLNADCDDANNLVYPYAGFQTVQDPKWGWDYNCDKVVSKQYTTTGVGANDSCVLTSGGFLSFCVGADGWTGAASPDCGETAESSMCNCQTSGGIIFFCNSCARVVSTQVAQGCR